MAGHCGSGVVDRKVKQNQEKAIEKELVNVTYSQRQAVGQHQLSVCDEKQLYITS